LASLFQGDNAQNASNPVVQKLTEQLTGSLEKNLVLMQMQHQVLQEV
jgi:hypothetical protein